MNLWEGHNSACNTWEWTVPREITQGQEEILWGSDRNVACLGNDDGFMLVYICLK